MSFNTEGSGTEQDVVDNMDDSDDVGEEEKALYDKEEENDEKDEEQDVNEDDEAKDEEEEEQEDSKVGEETDEIKEHMPSDIKVMQVCQPMFIQRPKSRAVTTLYKMSRRVHIMRAMWRMLCSRIYLVVI
jgi:hypothetical protein